MDGDDEVRDRATYFKVILEQQQQNLNSQFILNGLEVSLSSLERALHSYTLSDCARPFDMRSVPAASEEEVAAAAGRERKPSQPEGIYAYILTCEEL